VSSLHHRDLLLLQLLQHLLELLLLDSRCGFKILLRILGQEELVLMVLVFSLIFLHLLSQSDDFLLVIVHIKIEEFDLQLLIFVE
jgi:hypothetical protein